MTQQTIEHTRTHTTGSAALQDRVRARRLWYHDIELPGGVRTRFDEDYEVCPMLRGVDLGNAELIRWLDDRLPGDLSGRTVLDTGCADGLYTFWAARRGAKRVVGIERNRYNHEHAVWLKDTLGAESVDLLHGPIERTCSNESFDLVFCVGLIYHLIDPLGTLHTLRQRCIGTLVLASAIDLPDGDGAPLSRLDRYAIHSHGLWAFNVPMVRQLLTTAGFDILDETVDAPSGSRRYLALAQPTGAAQHHIFDATIDQEFPINVENRRQRVRRVWKDLAGRIDRPVAIFGAGTHTPWLLEQARDIPGVRVACVLDDRIPVTATVAGLLVRRPTDVHADDFDALVLSSWHQTDTLRQRARELFGDAVELVSFET